MAAGDFDRLLAYLQAAYPAYWEWLNAREGTVPLDRVRSIINDIANNDWGIDRMQRNLAQQVEALKSYQTFLTAPGTEPAAEEISPEEEIPFDVADFQSQQDLSEERYKADIRAT